MKYKIESAEFGYVVREVGTETFVAHCETMGDAELEMELCMVRDEMDADTDPVVVAPDVEVEEDLLAWLLDEMQC